MGRVGPDYVRSAATSMEQLIELVRSGTGTNDLDLLFQFLDNCKRIAHYLENPADDGALEKLATEIEELRKTIDLLRTENEELKAKLAKRENSFWTAVKVGAGNKVGERLVDASAAAAMFAAIIGIAAITAGPESATVMGECLTTYVQIA